MRSALESLSKKFDKINSRQTKNSEKAASYINKFTLTDDWLSDS